MFLRRVLRCRVRLSSIGGFLPCLPRHRRKFFFLDSFNCRPTSNPTAAKTTSSQLRRSSEYTVGHAGGSFWDFIQQFTYKSKRTTNLRPAVDYEFFYSNHFFPTANNGCEDVEKLRRNKATLGHMGERIIKSLLRRW